MANKRLETAVQLAFRQTEEQQEIIAEVIERMLLPSDNAPKLSPRLEEIVERIMHERASTFEYLKDK